MKVPITAALFAALSVCLCHGQGATRTVSPGQAGSIGVGQTVRVVAVELGDSLNSRKLKKGDEVAGKTLTELHTSRGMTIPRGSRVIGYVVETKARSKGDAESTLAIAFDKIRRSGGEETAINLVILAVAPNPSLASGDPGGHVDYGDRTAIVYHSSVPPEPGKAIPMLTDQSRGVVGIKNLQLGPDGGLSSSEKEVKLDYGTQLLLAEQPLAESATP